MTIFIGQVLWFLRINNSLKSYALVCKFNEALILMKHLFPTMSCSSLTDPALLDTHPQGWCISCHILISGTSSYKHSGHYHNNWLHSVTSGFSMLQCGRRADLKETHNSYFCVIPPKILG